MLKQSGISILEVLAAIFVIAIGLLGVLAVIPFGAFQVSKANHAEYASNMLANAAEEIIIREIAKPTEWGFNSPIGTAGPGPIEEDEDSRIILIPPPADDPTVTSTGTFTREVSTHEITDVDISAHPTHYTLLESFGQTVLARLELSVLVTIHCETVTIIQRFEGEPPLWITQPPEPDSGPILRTRPHTLSQTFHALNDTRYILFDPRENEVQFDRRHIFPLWSFEPAVPQRSNLIRRWEEIMRGQDDLLYTSYADKRPDFKDNRILSSGKYTWFFTILPRPADNWDGYHSVSYPDPDLYPPPGPYLDNIYEPLEKIGLPCDCFDPAAGPDSPENQRHQRVSILARYHIGDGLVPLERLAPGTADILACYNRVPTDDVQVLNVPFSRSAGGGMFTFPNADHLELLTQTKYLFVTWRTRSGLDGTWCKIVFLDKDERSAARTPRIVVVTEDGLPDRNNMTVYIPSGVLYHKKVEDVPIR